MKNKTHCSLDVHKGWLAVHDDDKSWSINDPKTLSTKQERRKKSIYKQSTTVEIEIALTCSSKVEANFARMRWKDSCDVSD